MLNKAIQTAANKTIPKGSRFNPKPWWDKDLDEKIQMRKKARDENRKDDLVKLNREISKAINESKQKSWQENVENLNPQHVLHKFGIQSRLWTVVKNRKQKQKPSKSTINY